MLACRAMRVGLWGSGRADGSCRGAQGAQSTQLCGQGGRERQRCTASLLQAAVGPNVPHNRVDPSRAQPSRAQAAGRAGRHGQRGLVRDRTYCRTRCCGPGGALGLAPAILGGWELMRGALCSGRRSMPTRAARLEAPPVGGSDQPRLLATSCNFFETFTKIVTAWRWLSSSHR